MKKVILILTVILVSALALQCTQEEVYMDDQTIVVDDVTKDGGDDIVPFDDDTSGGGTQYCKAWDSVEYKWHQTYNIGYNEYECRVSGSWGSRSTHLRGMTISMARAHCNEIALK